MRILHTADWHLGRLFYGLHLTEDQSYVLDQLVDLIGEAGVDAVVVAGDVYDRSVPPPDAVELLDETLFRIVRGCRVPVVMIAGNHDSPRRLSFGARLLVEGGLHLYGEASADPACVRLADGDGEVAICAIPYAEPARVRTLHGMEGVADHDAAMRALCQAGLARAGAPPGRTIVVAHAFVAGATASESERPLSVGGAGTVAADAFDGFDYVALGHLHRPQSIARAEVNYAGSLLKYSFSEAADRKSVSIVEMDGRGRCTIERVALTPRHDVRRIEGTLRGLLDDPSPTGDPNDYLCVTLRDTGALLDPIGKLRERYPNVLHLERSVFESPGGGEPARVDQRKRDDVALFSDFLDQTTGQAITDDERRVLIDVLSRVRRDQREVSG